MSDPTPLPADDGTRSLAVARPDTDEGLTHLAVVGDTYTILLRGADTAGRHALIDMLVPAGGGPPRHRHDFEETFHVLDGEIAVTLRGDEPVAARAGETVNIPANAPHSFSNGSDQTARLLCLVTPAGLEEYFAGFGDPVPSRTSPAPPLSDAERQERMTKATELAPRFRVENL
jgi:quercetin dioxygenase-like cupin family protein